MTEVIICGIGGKMGRVLYETAKALPDIKIVAGIDKFSRPEFEFPVYSSFGDCKEACDAVIDFSRPEALCEVLDFCKKKGCAAVLCSTGYTPQDKAIYEKASSEIPVFRSANMSLGINLLCSLVKRAAEFLGENFDVEIIEKHHNKKVDSPSGTALTLASCINSVCGGKKRYVCGRQGNDTKRSADEIGIHAVRGGTIAGEHDVMFIGNDEIITLSHTASSKQVFAEGAYKAAKFMKGKPAGIYSMDDMLG